MGLQGEQFVSLFPPDILTSKCDEECRDEFIILTAPCPTLNSMSTGAVVATVMIAVRKVLGRPEPSLIVSNEVFLEGIEVNEKDNNNAIPVAPREVLLM